MSQFGEIYRDEDVDISVLHGKTIAIIGYGSQGKAQGKSLRDSGINVIVALATEPCTIAGRTPRPTALPCTT